MTTGPFAKMIREVRINRKSSCCLETGKENSTGYFSHLCTQCYIQNDLLQGTLHVPLYLFLSLFFTSKKISGKKRN